MKKIFLLLCLLLNITTKSQTSSSSFLYPNIYDFFIDYRQNNIFNDTAYEDGFNEEIERAQKIWAQRLYPSGDFRIAANAIITYSQNFSASTAAACAPVLNSINWTSVGPTGTPQPDLIPINSRGVGQMHRIVFDPSYNGISNQIIYGCSGYGGLWRSLDDGNNWTVLNTDNQLPISSVSDIAVDYANSDNIFISTGDGESGIAFFSSPNVANINPLFTAGVYRSIDNGTTWHSINNGLLTFFGNGGVIRRILVNPTNSNELYIATSKGIFKSNNALSGTPTWQQLFTGNTPDEDFKGLEFVPGNTSSIYASSNKDIYISINSGINWTSITGFGTGLNLGLGGFPNNFNSQRINLAVSQADPSILYAYLIGENEELDPSGMIHKVRSLYLFKYQSGNWLQKHYQNYLNSSSPFQFNASAGTYSPNIDVFNYISPTWSAIAVSPVNANEVYFGHTIVRGTIDIETTPFSGQSGYNWTGQHADIHGLSFSPNLIGNKLFMATDGGISKYISSNNWQEKNNGLAVGTIWSFDINEIDKDMILIGNQDCGVNIKRGNSWSIVDGGDGYGASIPYDEDNIMIYNSNGRFIRYDLNTNTRVSENPSPSSSPTNFLPYDAEATGDKVAFPYIISKKHPRTGERFFNFTNLYKRKKKIPLAGDAPSDIWNIESDISKIEIAQWRRSITEFEIAESDPNFVYIATLGVDNGSGASWQLNPKLYRSTTGTNDGDYSGVNKFSDISGNFPTPSVGNVTPAVITGIAVSTINPQKLWVSFTGYDSQYKVYYSNDAGNSWINADPDGCLANLPVNAIVYQDGTNDRIYIGTDAGVYYKDNSMSSWVKYGNIPNCRVTELKINKCANKIVAATFGRGVWEADLLSAEPPSNSLQINSNTIWNDAKSIEQNIHIASGATLTVKNILYIPSKGKIVVDRGGVLIIDGGKITNTCGNMWQGIEVWGDRTKSQLTAGAQGKVIMKNGAIIENAIDGIVTIKNNPSGPDWSYTGGVVQAKDSKFINCYKGAVLLSYHNFHPVNTSTLLPNISYFRNCEFLTTGQVNAPANKPDAGIALYDIIGLNILGCDFKNTSPDAANSGIRGRGIVSYDAKFTVDDLCTSTTTIPCTSYKRSTFDGLKQGVHANNSNPLLAAKINHVIFSNNRLDCIYLAGMNYATVTNNDFNIDYNTPGSTTTTCGLYLDFCKYYSVQNNNFTQVSGGNALVGIYVKDSKNGAHELYKNKFTNLWVGIMPLQNNAGEKVVGGARVLNLDDGLTMHCNEFVGNRYDIAISSPSVSSPSSIAYVQGELVVTGPGSIEPKALVRNIYSANCSPSLTENKYYIKNSTYLTKPVIHVSNQQAFTQPLPVPNSLPQQMCSDLNVNVIPTTVLLSFLDDCPDNTILNNSILSAKIFQLGNEVDQQKIALTNLIDGGNTISLLNAINSNMSAGNLKNLLMSKSPYLSDAVLKAYLTKSSTPPNGHIKEVILANSPVTADVKQKVDLLNLPNGIQQQINAAQKGISARQAKEIHIIQLNYDKELAISDKIRYFLNDTIETNPVDSIIKVLKTYPRSENSCEIVGAYVTKGDFVKAQAVVDSLQAINQLDDFCQFQKLILQLNQTLEKCYKMQTDNVLKQQVEAAASDCTKDGCCNAQALLKQVFNYEYEELRMLPEEERSMQPYTEEETIEYTNGLSVYPNPANDLINFMFNSAEAESAIVEVRDVTGRLIESLQMKNGTTTQLNVSNYENAIYLLYLNINGNLVESKKLVIVK